jgi:hypothetical protein
MTWSCCGTLNPTGLGGAFRTIDDHTTGAGLKNVSGSTPLVCLDKCFAE